MALKPLFEKVRQRIVTGGRIRYNFYSLPGGALFLFKH